MSDFGDGGISNLFFAVKKLNQEQIRTLATDVNWDDIDACPSSATLQRLLSLSTSQTTELTRCLSDLFNYKKIQPHDIGIVLSCIAQERSNHIHEETQLEIVCTAPSRFGVPLRTTFATVMEMVQMAKQEILVVGYVFTGGARKIVEQIAVARRERGVRVTFIGNRMEAQLNILRSLWPPDTPSPLVFSRECDPTDEMTALHAKLIICDENTGLITSANFSHHGLHENIEIGAKIKSLSLNRIKEFFFTMIRNGELEKIEFVKK